MFGEAPIDTEGLVVQLTFNGASPDATVEDKVGAFPLSHSLLLHSCATFLQPTAVHAFACEPNKNRV
jgi:hypothetical protein